DLEAVLAGIAGARHERRRARDFGPAKRIASQGLEVSAARRLQDRLGARALDADQGRVQRLVVQLDHQAQAITLLQEERQVVLTVRGIEYEQELLRTQEEADHAPIQALMHRV